MWEWNVGKETIDVWLEERESPGLVFKDAEASWHRRLKQKAERDRLDMEKKKRLVEEDEAQRELDEQQPYTIVVEVHMVVAEDSRVEYVRAFHTPVADEVFPVPSQPQAEQSSQSENGSQPSTPPKHSQPTSPLNQPRIKVVGKKMTLRKRKTTAKTPPPTDASVRTPEPSPIPTTAPPHTPQPSPNTTTSPPPTPQPSPNQATSPPPTPQPSPNQATSPPSTPQPSTTQATPPPQTVPPSTTISSSSAEPTNACPDKPKKGDRSRPPGFKTKKSVGKKVAEGSQEQGVSLRRSGRSRKSPARVETSDDSTEDDRFDDDDGDDDDDYIESGSEPDDDDADLADFIEEECECLYDDIHEK
ncbi:extensin-like [Chenopodium quinoa]|uniref:extensin-like n=1 Tax=Chenopodium quinoa TaxID=63459 RepID=UPI000B77F5D8|nr:extensin-like [Chenopodium quinoa]